MKTIFTIIALSIFSTTAFCQIKIQKSNSNSKPAVAAKPATKTSPVKTKPMKENKVTSTSKIKVKDGDGDNDGDEDDFKTVRNRGKNNNFSDTAEYYQCPVCGFEKRHPGKCPHDRSVLERKSKGRI